MSSLKALLKDIKDELTEKGKMREETQNSMRKATSLAKQVILLIHQKKMKEAEQLVQRAKKIIVDLNKMSEAYPEIIFSGSFDAARQEFSEANIFLRLIKDSRLPTPKELGVPSVDYVLGLADVVGEYRRLALDALRDGDVRKSEKCLRLMDDIYTELMGLDEAYMLVPGLRRKCDVARRIIEITRGDVTQEIRRSVLEEHLKRFEKLAKNRNK